MEAKFFYKNENSPKPNKPPHIGVAAMIFNEHNQMLLEKRSDSNRWGLIGGGLEINETLKQCLEREVYEETGLKIFDYEFVGICDDPSRIAQYPDGNILRTITVLYKGSIPGHSGLKCSYESKELRFFNISQLKDLDIVETHRHIVDEYILSANAG